MASTDVEAVSAALADPARRDLLALVTRSARAVGRDEAAAALGIPRATAAFHLEKLAAAGLLSTEFRRLGGRSGPGAGRPAKLYRAVAEDVSVSVPARRYDLAAELFVSAIDRAEASGDAPRGALGEVSAELGRAIAGDMTSIDDFLAATGYEPVDDGEDGLRLTNCPFRRLARAHTETVCGANLALVCGALEATSARGLSARLEPHEGACCVRLVPSQRD